MTAARARTVSAVATLSAILATAPGARADDLATAQALFEAARVAQARGDYPAACPKFAESERLDPAAGTLLNLADCEEHLGHLALAWDAWHEGIALLPRSDERLPLARQHAQALESRLPRLLLQLAPNAPPGTTVRRDETEIGAASLGTALPVDPGSHVVRVEATGRIPSSTEVTLAEGETRTLDIAPGPPIPPPPENVPPVLPAPPSPPPRAPEGPHSNAGLRTAGWVVGGVGLVGLGFGAATGLLAMSEEATVNVHCVAAKGCDLDGYNAATSGHTHAIESDVSFAVGAALAAAGISLVLVARTRSNPTTVALAPSRGGAAIGLQGSF